MRIITIFPLAAALALSACMPPHPPPSAPPPQVAPLGTVVGLDQLPDASVARYLGTYRSGGASLTIRRVGGQLFADRNASPAAAPLALVGLGTFADASGTAYLFVPVDGSGTLRTIETNGTSRDWMR